MFCAFKPHTKHIPSVLYGSAHIQNTYHGKRIIFLVTFTVSKFLLVSKSYKNLFL